MKTKLKRCPFCNGHKFTLEASPICFWIQCLNCRATGPQAYTRGEAVQVWNRGQEGSTALVNLPPGQSNRNDLKEVDL